MSKITAVYKKQIYNCLVAREVRVLFLEGSSSIICSVDREIRYNSL